MQVPELTASSTDLAAALVFDLLDNPSARILRTTETISMVDAHTVLRTVELSILTGGCVGPVRVPLFRWRRNRLVTDQKITAQDGILCRSLNRREAMEQNELILRALIEADGASFSSAELETLEKLCNRVVYGSGTESSAAAEAISQYDSRSDSRLLASYARRFSTHDLTWAYLYIPSGYTTVRLSISYESRNAIRVSETASNWARRGLERFLNHTAQRFQIRCPLVHASQSYHLMMHGPQDHFVRLQAFVLPDGNIGNKTRVRAASSSDFSSWEGLETSDESDTATHEQVLLGLPTSPGNLVHLYANNTGRPKDPAPDISAAVSFMERPPGVTAVTAAIGCFTLALLVAALVVGVGGSSSAELLPLLAIGPSVLGATLLPGQQDSWVRRGPVRARWSLISFGVLSFSSAAFLLAASAIDDEGRSQLLFNVFWFSWWIFVLGTVGWLTIRLFVALLDNWKTFDSVCKADSRLTSERGSERRDQDLMKSQDVKIANEIIDKIDF